MSSLRADGGRISVSSLSRHHRDVINGTDQPINHGGDNDVTDVGGGGSSFVNHVLSSTDAGLRRISTTVSPEYSRLPKTFEDPGEVGFVPAAYVDDDLDGESLDGDVADSDDYEAKRECCGEARLNCGRFTREMRKEGRKLKKCCSKCDFRSYIRGMFSLEVLKSILPIIRWAPKYSLEDLQGDLVSGTTVGLTVLPQAIAYTALAGVRPEFGLYSSYISSIVYTFFGPSKDVTLGPSAISSLMTWIYASSFSPVVKDATLAILASFFCGFIYIGMSIFRLGFIVEFVSLSVMKAFTVASAVTIAMSQVKRWWGLTGVPSDFLPQLYWTVKKIPETRLWDFLLGLVCIFIIVILRKLKEMPWKTKYSDLPLKLKILNRTLFYLGLGRNIVAIVLATIATYIFYANNMLPFNITGYIPPGIPAWKIPNMTLYDPKADRTYELPELAGFIGIGFILIPVLGLLEVMAIGSVFARRFGYRMQPNQELLAHGIGNVCTALASGYPVCGTFSRTAVNAQSGARTPAGGLVTGAIVLLSLQFLTPVFFFIPNASLSCVIIMAVIDMITFQKLWIFWKTNRIDVIPWIVTFILSFCISIAWGVIIGAGLSLILLVYPAARPRIKLLKQDGGSIMGGTNVGPGGSVMLVTFDNGLMYPAIEHMKNKIIPVYESVDLPKGLVFDLSHVSTADTTTVMGMRLMLENCQKKGLPLVVCNLQRSVDKMFQKAKMKYYRRADNVEAAVKLIFNTTTSITEHVIAIGGAIPKTNNNNAYDNSSFDMVDEVGRTALASGPVHQTTNGKDGSKVVDDSVIKKLARDEAERVIRQHQ